ncbi:MAG: glycosyltransferase, partial [Flavobacteriales bacterium]|nr:glycosyltransferase [Flavobacteriales bacterium]
VYDESYHQECLRLIDRLEGSIRVRILDPIAHDELKKVIKQHHVLFLPTRGENFGHIILESFMMGRPVLISDQTPWRNLESQGVGFDLALKDEQAWTKRLDFFLQMDQTHFDAMCRAAHEKYQEFCNDPEIVKASKGLFLSSE